MRLTKKDRQRKLNLRKKIIVDRHYDYININESNLVKSAKFYFGNYTPKAMIPSSAEDIESRRHFVAELSKDFGIINKPDDLIYVEPDFDYFDEFEIFKSLPNGNTIYKDFIKAFKKGYTSILGSTVIKQDFISAIKQYTYEEELPSSLENKVIIAYYSTNAVATKDTMYHPLEWTIVHEIAHGLLNTRDEQAVNKYVFHYMYDMGFIDIIGYTLVNMFEFVYVKGNVRYGLVYSIFDYAYRWLRENDRDLLYAYLMIIYDGIQDDDNLKGFAESVMYAINKLIEQGCDEHAYEGYWF